MTLIRTENAQVLWGFENPTEISPYGTPGLPVIRFGIHDVVNTPDPEIAWTPFYGVGSGRNRADIFPGRWELKGSIPDIRVQRPEGTGALGYAQNVLVLCMGQLIDLGSTWFVAESLDPDNNDERLRSFTMEVAMHGIDGSFPVVRRYYGGKVNRWSLIANEGDSLRLNLDEIIFKGILHNILGVVGYDPSVIPSTDSGPAFAGQYYFAGATITVGGANICRIKNFTISGDNQLQPKYYVCKDLTNSEHDTQLLNDLVEGKRIYTLTFDIDVADSQSDFALFEFLLNQGRSNVSGEVIGYDFNAFFENADGSQAVATMQIVGTPPGLGTPPAAIVTGGAINLPAPPAGYWSARYTLNIKGINILQTKGN